MKAESITPTYSVEEVLSMIRLFHECNDRHGLDVLHTLVIDERDRYSADEKNKFAVGFWD